MLNFWYRAKVYFTCIKSLLWLIIVPNMNKINLFFSEILWQTKFKKNIAIITQIWYRTKWYFTCVSNTWYLITVPNMNTNPFSEISQQVHKMYEKVAIITQIWHRVICYYTSMSNAWYLVTVPKYEQNHYILGDITANTQNVFLK